MIQVKPAVATSIRNILFDLGGVLLDIDVRKTIDAFARLHLLGLKAEQVHPHNTGVFLELETGAIGETEFVSILQSYADTHRGKPVPTREKILNAWNALLLDYDWRRFELLDQLRESGYNLYLLSNTNPPHRERLLATFERGNPDGRTFESYFDGCYYSDVMRLRKPDPEIYHAVLQDARLNASETLFIDDNQPNTDAATQLGIQGYHLRRTETIFDLFEVK